ncbi:MAG: H-NS histone family protein [Gammaproteobacteria bacterium]|nr:H-NS histone family protein [Gammaproteobacteria bacterium]MBU2435931.1 H-NS histone family protein [Gammaproteobacteria bacterium]MBU2449287.1 H-NS histone family protein [Gammaproteobacteria bacterium]
MDISTLSVAQLRDLQQQIPAEIKRREAQEKVTVLNELRAIAKTRGYAIEDLLGKEVKVKASSGNKVKVKYRHPQNVELEWTGRGRKPKWVEAWVANGGSLDNLLV